MRFKEFSGEWKQDKLKNIVSIHARIGWHGLRQEEFLDNGDYYLITGTDFIDGKLNYKNMKFIDMSRYEQDKNIQIENEDILITKDGTIGKVALVTNLNKKATLNAGVYRLRKETAEIDNIYLYNYLKAPFLLTFAYKESTGGTIKHLNQSQIINIKIPYGTLEEQQEIANFLTLIDKRIETQMKIIEEYKSLIQNIKNKIIENLIFVKWIKIKDICTITTGKLDANAMKENGKYKFFTCSKDDYYINEYAFDGEALIISGNGELGLIKYYNGKFNAYQRTYVLHNFKLSPIYIKFMMEYYLPRKIYKEKNVGAMPYIVLSTIAELEIPVADNRIIEKIEQLYLLLNKRQNIDIIQLNHLKKQKQFLLNNMFI